MHPFIHFCAVVACFGVGIFLLTVAVRGVRDILQANGRKREVK